MDWLWLLGRRRCRHKWIYDRPQILYGSIRHCNNCNRWERLESTLVMGNGELYWQEEQGE